MSTPNRSPMPAAVAALFALLLGLVATPAAVTAATWEIDTVHSDVSFEVRHFVSRVPGRFNDFEGTIVYDPAKPEAGSVEFTIDAASIDTRNERRDGHLRSEDFFDVEKYPTLSFESVAVKVAGDDELHVTGDLTIHGVTKRITVPVEVLGTADTGRGVKAGFATEFTIDRKDYGIVWNRTLDQGGAMLSDEVEIEINVEADRVEAPAEDAASE